jgi:hypothetical protein
VFLGTKPNEDICKLVKGIWSKGPATRSASISLEMFCFKVSKLLRADSKFSLNLNSRHPSFAIPREFIHQ